MSKVVQRNYSIAGKTLEEIVEQVRLVLSYEGDVSRITITRGNITAEYVVPNNEPPYGEIPDTPIDNLADVLGRARLEQVSTDSYEVNPGSISYVTSALMQARSVAMSPVAWVVSDNDVLQSWLGLQKPINRLLNTPVYVIDRDSLPPHNLVLLCGKTSAVSPLKSEFGILIDMES